MMDDLTVPQRLPEPTPGRTYSYPANHAASSRGRIPQITPGWQSLPCNDPPCDCALPLVSREELAKVGIFVGAGEIPTVEIDCSGFGSCPPKIPGFCGSVYFKTSYDDKWKIRHLVYDGHQVLSVYKNPGDQTALLQLDIKHLAIEQCECGVASQFSTGKTIRIGPPSTTDGSWYMQPYGDNEFMLWINQFALRPHLAEGSIDKSISLC